MSTRPRPKTDTQRRFQEAEWKAGQRARRRAQGYTLQQVWVHTEDLARFRRYVERLRRTREETP
jgi:transposase